VELSSNLDAVSAILQICLIDLLLSGDNAILIAMACAGLPAAVRPKAVLLGTGAAVLFRVVLTFVATLMLRAPYLKLIGAGLLLLIAIELLAGDGDGQRAGAGAGADSGIWRAIVLIVVADAVMSLDNVVAVAAAAQDNLLYLVLGLVISVPILVFSSLYIARLLDAYPLIIDAGGALLGWIAGKTAVADPAIAGVLNAQSFGLVAAAPLLGAAYVLIQGRRLRVRRSGSAAPVRRHLPLAAADPPAQARAAAAVAATAATPVMTRTPSVLPTPPTPPAALAPPPPPPALESAPATAAEPVATPAEPGAAGAPPRRFTPMDLTIMAGVAVPLVGLIVMIVYFVLHAALSH
jgi:YjbE family integral membrane protein